MQGVGGDPPGDGCDRMLGNVKTPCWGDRRRRFLDAYRQYPVVAPAARLAGVHRSSIYRWMADPAFVAAMRALADEFFDEHRAKVLAAEEARRAWRAERERARHPMRCYHLARARAARG